MRALVFRDGRPVLVERPDPAAAPGEAIVRVLLAGICGTDLEIAKGYMAFDGVPGHEFVGIVERAPDRSWIGRRVVGEINAACGECAICAAGLPRHCPRRTVLGIAGRDGAFAERLALPLVNLHRVPDDVPDEVAVLAEPLAAAWEIPEQVAVVPGSRTAVVGDGRLAQLCARVLARVGAPPVVIGRHAEKLRHAERIGLVTAVEGGVSSREFDLVVDATGAGDGAARALDLVRPRGTVVLKSTRHGASALDLTRVVVDEITLVGSRCGPFAPALAHLVASRDDLARLVTARYDLEDASDAFARATERDAIKVVLAS